MFPSMIIVTEIHLQKTKEIYYGLVILKISTLKIGLKKIQLQFFEKICQFLKLIFTSLDTFVYIKKRLSKCKGQSFGHHFCQCTTVQSIVSISEKLQQYQNKIAVILPSNRFADGFLAHITENMLKHCEHVVGILPRRNDISLRKTAACEWIEKEVHFIDAYSKYVGENGFVKEVCNFVYKLLPQKNIL